MKMYARVVGGKLVDMRSGSAPLVVGGVTVYRPGRRDLFKAGLRELSEDPIPEGHEVVGWTYRRSGGQYSPMVIVPITRKARKVKTPRRFSRERIHQQLEAVGKWDEAKAWMVEHGVWDSFSLCSYVDESNPSFVGAISAFKDMLGLTDEQAETFLSAVTDPEA